MLTTERNPYPNLSVRVVAVGVVSCWISDRRFDARCVATHRALVRNVGANVFCSEPSWCSLCVQRAFHIINA